MKAIKYYSKKESLLANYLQTEYSASKVSELTFFEKLLFKKEIIPDIYFYSKLDDNSSNLIEKSKLTIVNSNRLKDEILKSKNSLDSSKVDVFYPTFILQEIKPKDAKMKLLSELNIEDKKTKVILFYAKNLKTSGAIEFVNIIKRLQSDNFIAIIAGESKQIYTLKFQITKYINMPNLFLIDNFENPDLLLAACDIYILPTEQQSFSLNVLKAMYYKSAVFVSNNNDASEIIDVFATLDGVEDRTASFKVDALLLNNSDLKMIKKDNKKIARKHLFEVQIDRLKSFINTL